MTVFDDSIDMRSWVGPDGCELRSATSSVAEGPPIPSTPRDLVFLSDAVDEADAAELLEDIEAAREAVARQREHGLKGTTPYADFRKEWLAGRE